MRELLGGKGANLSEMTRLNVPVPAGFTITTEVCAEYYRSGRRLPKRVREDVQQRLARVEKAMGARFGDARTPLLVSVRSGARVSMPGMMDSVLNLGLNDATVEGLVAQSGDRRFAFDSYRRFVQMYGDVVLGVDHGEFEARLERGGSRTTASSTPTSCARSSRSTRSSSRRARARRSRSGRSISSGARCAPSSTRGRRRERSPIASSTTSRTIGARP
jgi:hypothetical protein